MAYLNIDDNVVNTGLCRICQYLAKFALTQENSIIENQHFKSLFNFTFSIKLVLFQ